MNPQTKSNQDIVVMPCIDHQYLVSKGNGGIEVRPEHRHEIKVHSIHTGVRVIQVIDHVCVEVLS